MSKHVQITGKMSGKNERVFLKKPYENPMKTLSKKNKIYPSAVDVIGNTPVVELSRIVEKHGLDGRIFAKLEFLSPGLSKKDRIAKFIIEEAERGGLLKPGMTVIESTSGNTGIALAFICAIKGYPFVAVMSEGNTRERRFMIEQFGGRVELVSQHPDSPAGLVTGKDLELVRVRFDELANELGAFKVGQFTSALNPLAHYTHTAAEILSDVPDLDAFVDFVGTGGSFEGIAKYLRENRPEIKCFIAEPASEAHIIQGGGYFKKVPFAHDCNCDGRIKITCAETLEWQRELSTIEGIGGGISSGSNLAGAVHYLRENPGKRVLFLVNDTALNYASRLGV